MKHTLNCTTHLTAVGYNSGDTGTEFTTCLGRIVWGHPLKPQDKTKDDVKVLDSNGQPIKVWSFGVAFPKADFQASIWPHLAAEAGKGYPNGVPNNFTYKYKDGDTDTDAKGNPLSGKTGYAGNYVIAFSTELQPPQCFVFENGAYRQIDETMIKTGDYVLVGVNAKWHGPNPNARGSRPGLYINPLTVLLCYQGEAISGSYQADPNAMFGAAPPQVAMPAGAAPVGAPAPAAAGGMPAAPGSMPGMGNGSVGAGAGMPAASMPGAGTAAPGASAAPMQMPSAPGGMPGVGGTPTPPAPTGPQRPTDPTHIHNNGNGTEQWFVNGAWDGGAHPVPAAGGALPPPATGFVDQAAGMPGMPGAMPPR